MKKRVLAMLLCGALLMGALSGCGGAGASSASTAADPGATASVQATEANTAAAETAASTAETEQPPLEKKYRELKVGSTDMFSTGHFDISSKLNTTYNCYSVFLAYDPLIYMDPETNEYTSDILKEWGWDDSLPGVVLTLRDDVYFSNGDQMNAEDILYTYQRQTAVSRQQDQFMIMLIDQATISDDGFTISIPFAQEYGAWQVYFGGNSGVMNKDYIEANGGDDLDFYDYTKVCGSGPYAVTDFQLNAYTVYEKRDDWWFKDEAPDGYATYDKITVYYYSDATTMMVDYETGNLDVALGLTESDYRRVLEDSSLGSVSTMPSKCVAMINMDVNNTATKDENLRKAMALGTDTELLAELAFGTLQEPAQSTLSKYNPASVSGLTYEYDPEEARKIVKENGLEGTTLKWICSPGAGATIAEAFYSMMEQIGIHIEIETYDMATAVVMWMEPGATSFLLDGASFGNTANEPHNQYQMMASTGVWPTAAKDDKVDELINAGRNTTDMEKRNAAYQELQQYLYDNYYVIPICEWSTALCYNSTVRSVTPTETSLANLRFIMPAE